MSTGEHGAFPAWIDIEILKGVLQPGLETVIGHPVEIRDIVLREFNGSSSFAAGRVEARLGSGQAIAVFVKDLNPTNQLADAKLVRDSTLDRSRREVHVYRDILTELTLGTPAFYGALWDEEAPRYWLLLEDAGPKRLSRLGNFDLWVEASGWLGRFHGSVAARDQGVFRLPPLQVDEIRERCLRVWRLMQRVEPEQRPILERGLLWIDGLIKEVFDTPVAMMHGEFFGKNVVIRPSGRHGRIAVIDWETAAVGPQYLDLVSITGGRWASEHRQAMRRAYFESVRECVDIPDWAAFNQNVDAASIVNAYSWLGWWSDGDEAHISRWLSEALFAVEHMGEVRR